MSDLKSEPVAEHIEHQHANLFGGANPAGTIANAVMSIQFTPEEISAILTVISIALKAAGLQGLQDIVTMMFSWEQQWVAKSTPAANK